MPAPAKSNIALLTEGAAYIQRAKRARQDQIEEIKFDDAARKDWLTGFSKRKKAKVEERRARAKERDRLAHVEERRKARQELKERAAQNVKDVRTAMGINGHDGSEDEGSEAGPSSPRQHEAEYSDEDQLATVTITEDFDPSALPTARGTRAGSSSSAGSQPSPTSAHHHLVGSSLEKANGGKAAVPLMPASSKKAQGKAKREADKAKAQKQKEKEKEKSRSRSMETGAERKKGRLMESRRRAEKASRAIERDGRRRGRESARGGKGAKRGKGKPPRKGGKR